MKVLSKNYSETESIIKKINVYLPTWNQENYLITIVELAELEALIN